MNVGYCTLYLPQLPPATPSGFGVKCLEAVFRYVEVFKTVVKIVSRCVEASKWFLEKVVYNIRQSFSNSLFVQLQRQAVGILKKRHFFIGISIHANRFC